MAAMLTTERTTARPRRSVARAILIAALGAALVAVARPATAERFAPPGGWASPLLRDHPLVGHIWSTARREFVAFGDLVAHLARSDFVMLSEKHDNADHHGLQALALRALTARGRRPALAFEMLTTDQEQALAAFLAAKPQAAAGLGPAVGWARSGWPDWGLYAPIAQVALDHGLPIVAAGLDRATVQKVVREGLGALDPLVRLRLELDKALLDPGTRTAMRWELHRSHCDMLPAAMIDGMIVMQRVRDAFLALRLSDAAAGADGGVLIAGAGHARADRAVPAHLARMAPGRSVAAVAWIEVVEDETAPHAYAGAFGATVLPFDYVWFTPRADDEDPCAAFAARRKARSGKP